MLIAIMGFGTVGSGVAELAKENFETVKKNTGASIQVKRILDIRDFENSPFAPLMTKNFEDIENDSEIELVVETMGGINPAFDFVSRCLKKGKSVVTSNKELVAKKGAELLALAKENNCSFLFEASVGGGIPIIRPMTCCLAGNSFNEIAGILNGTTNFILTKMIMEGMSFEDALKIAQDLGYAEKDPTADVEGIDACRKIAILASLAVKAQIYPEAVHTEGITQITSEDVSYADKMGYVIKLIARAKRLESGKLAITVSPAFVQKNGMLSGVNDVFNACLVRGDRCGEVMLYGRGAGKDATASAVMGDIIDCAINGTKNDAFGWDKAVDGIVENYLNVPVKLFVRSRGEKSHTAKLALDLNSTHLISEGDELCFISEEKAEGEIRKALKESDVEILSTIRVTDL